MFKLFLKHSFIKLFRRVIAPLESLIVVDLPLFETLLLYIFSVSSLYTFHVNMHLIFLSLSHEVKVITTNS